MDLSNSAQETAEASLLESTLTTATLADGSSTAEERAAKRPRSSAENNDVAPNTNNGDGGSVGLALDFSKQAVLAAALTVQQTVHPFVEDAAQPSLPAMPAAVLINILKFVNYRHLHVDLGLTILAFERTCRAFRDLLANDETWGEIFQHSSSWSYAPTNRESAFMFMHLRNIRQHQKDSSNILLEYMGGANGVRHIVESLLVRMGALGPSTKVILRGDSIYYLMEVLQGHMIDKLEKTHMMVIEKLSPGDGYPGIHSSDLLLLDRLLDRRRSWGSSVPLNDDCCNDDCCNDEQILGAEEKRKMVRSLAYRAGVVKMSVEAFSLIANEILQFIYALVDHAFVSSDAQCPIHYQGPDNPRYIRSTDEEAAEEEAGESIRYGINYYAVHDPPIESDQDGKTGYVIIPRHIKDAAVKFGMKPLLGFGIFGLEWAASSDDKQEDEIDEAEAQYYLEEDSEPPSDPEPEQESDESSFISLLEGESFDSDGENNRN